MSHKFSLAHLTALGCATPELVYIAKMAGYDYVSPRIVRLGIPNEPNYELANNPVLLKQTQRVLEETGLAVHDVELFRITDTKEIAEYEPAIEIAAKLKAKHLLCSVWTPNKAVYTPKFAQLCDIAAAYNLSVQLEFVTWADVTNLKEAKALLDSVNRSNAGIMVDTLHAYRSKVAPAELDTIPKHWFNFCHVCDGPAEIPDTKPEMIPVGRDGRYYVGEGRIDVAAYIKHMPNDIVCSIELPHLEKVKEFGAAEHARRCLATAKDYFSVHKL